MRLAFGAAFLMVSMAALCCFGGRGAGVGPWWAGHAVAAWSVICLLFTASTVVCDLRDRIIPRETCWAAVFLGGAWQWAAWGFASFAATALVAALMWGLMAAVSHAGPYGETAGRIRHTALGAGDPRAFAAVVMLCGFGNTVGHGGFLGGMPGMGAICPLLDGCVAMLGASAMTLAYRRLRTAGSAGSAGDGSQGEDSQSEGAVIGCERACGAGSPHDLIPMAPFFAAMVLAAVLAVDAGGAFTMGP